MEEYSITTAAAAAAAKAMLLGPRAGFTEINELPRQTNGHRLHRCKEKRNHRQNSQLCLRTVCFISHEDIAHKTWMFSYRERLTSSQQANIYLGNISFARKTTGSLTSFALSR